MEQTTDTTVDVNVDSKEEIKVEATPETEVAKKEETKVEDAVETEKEIMIPKTRFDEVNGKYKELSTQVKEMKKANEDLKQTLEAIKQASEQETTLVKQTAEQLENQVKSYETVMNELVKTKLETVPEDMKDLIPEGLNLEQQLAWINKAEAKGLFKSKVVNIPVGQPLNHSSEQNKAERVKKMNPLQALTSYYSQNK